MIVSKFPDTLFCFTVNITSGYQLLPNAFNISIKTPLASQPSSQDLIDKFRLM